MASAEKLRENLFSITWSGVNCGLANNQVTVMDLPDVFESCQLSWNRINGQQILDLNFVVSKTLKPTNLQTMSILATNNGVKQKMKLENTKWTTTWMLTAGRNTCQYCGNFSTTSFNILIDLTPDMEFTVKKGATHVLDHILNLWKTKTLSDVTFRCNDKEIKAHVMIVASCSPVLAAMFTNDYKESHERIVDIKDFTPDTFSRLLRFMYTGDASLETDVTEEEIDGENSEM